ASPAPYFDLEQEYSLQQCIRQLIQNDLIESCHDVSEGGLLTTLFESAFPGLGFDVSNTDAGTRSDAFWFGEAQSRVVVTVSEKLRSDFWQQVQQLDIPVLSLGKVTSGTIAVDGQDWGAIDQWKNLYDTAIEKHLSKELDSEEALAMI
ncbi:MAG TPA: AIR synthase-related protein, partial [Flavisolibacter sp.]|nr:AIR synthase-related protein [Flavisolibacter sp.]